MTLGESESEQLRETLERISANNPDAKRIIDRARADYEVTPFVESVELDPGLDQALQDILENVPEEPKET